MSSLSTLLKREGISITPYSLLPGSTPIGETAQLGNAEVTYRQDDEVLTIILYRRLIPSRGLGNAFAEMKWLLEFIRRRMPEIKKLVTTAMRVKHADGVAVPSPEKLLMFYKQYFNAEDDGYVDGQQWLKLEMTGQLAGQQLQQGKQQ